MHGFYSISSNIDEVLSINTSANAFVIIFVSQMTLLRLLTFLLGSQTDSWHSPACDSPALLDLFLSSDASICFTMAFPPLGNSDYNVVTVSIDFPTNS